MIQSQIQLLQEIDASSDKIWCLEWHPNGKLFVASGGDKKIKLYGQKEENKHIYELKQVIENEHDKTIRYLKFSPNGKLLASASFDTTINIFIRIDQNDENLQSYKFLQKVEGHENEVKGLDWDITSKYLVSCSRDKSCWIWDYDQDFEFSCNEVLDGHTQVRFIPKTQDIVSCSYDDTIKIWMQDDDTWRCATTLNDHKSIVWSIDFNQSGSVMASVSEDKQIKIWNKNQSGSGKNYYILNQTLTNYHTRPIYTCSFSSDGMLLATGGGDNLINIFSKKQVEDDDPQSIKYEFFEKQNEAHSQDINCVLFNPKDDILITSGDDKKIKIWEINLY